MVARALYTVEHGRRIRPTRSIVAVRSVANVTGSRARLAALFVLASVLFGGTFVAAKTGQVAVPPLLLVALRFDLAAVLLLGYAAATVPREKLLPRTRGDVAAVLAAGVFAIGGANALLFVGQGSVSSAVGAIVFGLVPILSPLLASALLADERLSAPGAVGTLIGLLGVGLVIGIDPAALGEAIGGGVLLVFAGAACAALGGVLIRRATTSTPSAVRTAWALPISALGLHAASALAGESLAAVEWTPVALASIGYLGVFAGAIAYIAYFDLLESVGVVRSSLTFYVSPAVAALGGWALLGESLPPTAALGFATIVVGFAFIGHEQLASALARVRVPDRSPPASQQPTIATSTGDRYVRQFDVDGD